jgi:hypothetical protein
MTPDEQNERMEKDVVALPLTHHEVLVVMHCVGMASKSERTNDAQNHVSEP